ncbi:hypothetical protein N784_06400 [Pontibacillus litoralis JSM 072002]|uniref:Uncharacterized protein n=1 Tax=Pontibacillus litoralis JSM 072002 TaxID=1385512 RepID=A0A0A5G4G7_9BACI|nr:hypothetical protein N784_06400 [Pontibacillus litoralis JSM 072002]
MTLFFYYLLGFIFIVFVGGDVDLFLSDFSVFISLYSLLVVVAVIVIFVYWLINIAIFRNRMVKK